MIIRAKNSATALVNLITSELPGFRDEAVYHGAQVFFYKRVQILVGDLWAAFGKQQTLNTAASKVPDTGLQALVLPDIGKLTMFADYRVPQVLTSLNLIQYSTDLARRIQNREELFPGSPEEVEIRAATVQAVEKLKEVLSSAHGVSRMSVELDWWLWQTGEKSKDTFFPHHRTLTCFY
eukprot:gb/GECG01005061.1/.p1 GENE.gb/GECG01005061.1/~~gb/GECG01005061.1/.p1  ORF type:complete len:179 (+),score=19.50 gb/GECG01005061.1/:1-537(+)